MFWVTSNDPGFEQLRKWYSLTHAPAGSELALGARRIGSRPVGEPSSRKRRTFHPLTARFRRAIACGDPCNGYSTVEARRFASTSLLPSQRSGFVDYSRSVPDCGLVDLLLRRVVSGRRSPAM